MNLCGALTRAGSACARPSPCAYHTAGIIVLRQRRDFAARLYEKTIAEPMSGCWIWLGTVDRIGYGHIRLPGKDTGVVLAHRASYELSVGPIPSGLNVLHSCDVPPCLNPAHLHLGTHTDNMREMAKRGRQRGPAHHVRRSLLG